ncbi:hypothetical protein LX32DRAFT_643205 [Colletotrichum zoysiae]|uniref:Uncharacterized protein n=1 Tax=Colletotrichum zoysiae TaxID=1216348 RepID=A0AAD9HAQ3_9PEZI|nr:hypothetical protein LX32DRAFT_643205 [Colletotrichum zoysiae]
MVVPLAFCVVNAKLRASNTNLAVDNSDPVSSNQEDLSVLMETIRSFFPQYDGVELIKETVTHAVDLVHTAGQALSNNFRTPPTSWTQILVGNPALYLKMVMTIDLSINKGRLAEDDDFPTGLFSNMRCDITQNHAWVSRQGLGFDMPPEPIDSDMDPCMNCYWGSGASTLAQYEDMSSRVDKANQTKIDQTDIQGAEIEWEGRVSLGSTAAEYLCGYTNTYATDPFSKELKTWANTSAWDMELINLAEE